MFLFAYLNLNRWHVRYAHITIGWLAILGLLIALALFDPSIASGIARLSLLAVSLLGFGAGDLSLAPTASTARCC